MMKTLDWTRILRNAVITAFLAYGSMSFWTQAHWSMLAWGAAIGGLVELGFQAGRDR
ncbi:MAG: hypothetical protein J7545_22420 [Roseofilum sp. SBFL]|uniref:hypothetical protein n=2 Tax=unclassified Roseofilum TaxID=2620099 RepID=UPI001AFE0BE3|nr:MULTISPECIES: hypothetical protein [unclassified Roseofilum]MBP0023502.1 hypothetical protein [Roseofilum sp. SID2]MBP0031756.1 hypothetical protein [Roseofilum sp. Belize BBD 4]MBP0044693.1 hypothetical protein [Roseofilum sp. SBFL]